MSESSFSPFSQNGGKDNNNTSNVGENCLICGRITDTLHFQITSCRACSAFFRRALQTKKKYACQRGTKKCDLTKRVIGKPICRYCRFKKCIDVGMKVTEIAKSQKPINNPLPAHNVPQFQETEDIPKNLLKVDCKFVGQSMSVNWEKTVESLQILLNTNPTFIPKILSIELSELQRFHIGLSRLTNYGKPKGNSVSELNVINDKSETKIYMVEWYQTYLTILTEMLTGLKQFMKLSVENRFSMFKKFWMQFQCIERIYRSTMIFGYDCNDTRMLMDDKHVCDCLNDCFTLSDLSADEKEKYKQLHKPFMKNFVTNIMKPIKELQISETEVAYLGLMLLWDIRDIEGLEPKSKEYANEVIDRSSNEMHNYYTYEMKQPNYATRLIKLSQIISSINYQTEERKKIATIAQVFNLFTYDLTDCQIIDH
uniref:Uncharacterized protein n=1 Tax=Panagrolaimus sp. PS1159 TaxID=55785 RepID=A0AC35GIG3_9BILA